MKLEETVIVTVSLLGMAETGTGTATFVLDTSNDDFLEMATNMHSAFTGALGEAMLDVFPAFQQYTKTRYGQDGVDNHDNE